MMPRIISSRIMTPAPDAPVIELRPEAYGDRLRIRNAVKIDISEDLISQFPDIRAVRAMSRAAVLLVATCLPLKQEFAPRIEADPFRFGIYCALDVGPLDYATIQAMQQVPESNVARVFRELWPPKQHFKFLPNVAPAHVGAMLNANGPIMTFLHSQQGCRHALNQASFDLEHEKIDFALVCSAFSLEDPLLTLRTRLTTPESMVLSEGAAAIVLSRGGSAQIQLRWPLESRRSYGIATPLMALLEGEPNAV